MHQCFGLFDYLGHEFVDTFLFFFVGNIRLEDEDVKNWLFVLGVTMITSEATERSPNPELMVILIPKLSCSTKSEVFLV